MRREDEGGFTFVELLVVIVVLGIVMSAITSALITVIRTAGGTADRMSQSHDAQLLSTWLVPDLQSANAPTGVTIDEAPAPPPGGGDCASPSPTVKRLEKLTLSWTDAASGVAYTAVYAISSSPTWELTRTFSVDAVAEPTFTVVHNLEDPAPSQPLPPGATARYPVCIEQEPGGKVTLTVTTLVNANAGNGSYQFTFSVAGQTRQPFAPPAPATNGPPISAETATNPDGRIDFIHVEFDQLVACVTNPCGTTGWSLTGAPGPVTIDAVTLGTDNRTATLAVSGADVDTAAVGMKVALTSGGMVGAGPTPAVLPPTDVADGMAPILHDAISKDTDAEGRLDKVALVFSEVVTLTPGLSSYTLLGGPDGNVIPTGIAGTGKDYLLDFPPTNPVVDTVVAGAELRISAGTALDGPRSNPTADVAVDDGMAPLLTGLVADAGSADGRITQMTATFSEPVTGVPTVGHNGSNVPVASAVPAGNNLVLTLAATAPVDTGTLLYSVSGTVSDASAANVLVLTNEAVADDVGPRLIQVNTTAPGPTAGLIEVGDAVTFTFSEPLASVPPFLQMNVTAPGGGPPAARTTNFALPGFASVAMTTGTTTSYGAPLKLDMSLVRNGSAVDATVGSLSSGTPLVATAVVGKATPDATLMDGFNNGVSTGVLNIPSSTLF